jgi:hypothetical protein
MTYLSAILFLAIFAALGSALFFMLRGAQPTNPAKSKRMARALAVRVSLSIALFLCILIAWKLGYIQPTGIAPGR